MWWYWLNGLIWGLAFGFLITSRLMFRFFEVRKKFPYRWKCRIEGCQAELSTDISGAMILELAERHMQQMHLEESEW